MLPLVPAPTHLRLQEGPGFRLVAPVRLVAPDAARLDAAAVAGLADFIGEASGGPSVLVHGSADGSPTVVLELTEDAGERTDVEPSPLPLTREAAAAEAYTLTVDSDRVLVRAARPAGLFRGATTLIQLLQTALVREEGGAPVLPALHIEDSPRYAWRGVMIDVVRHFFDVDVLKEVIDLAALYKLNALHLHLTDDQGWRLELASRPRLTELSGTSQVGGGPAGFLTRADWEDLLEHAAARRITLVPEIDVPGHVNAALHAYGELTPSGEPTPVFTGAHVGFSKITLNEPATLPFVRDVFTELAELTPGPYVHGGGDEVDTITSADYADFVEVLGEIVTGTGKTLVVWQEAAAADLPDGAVVQLWASTLDPSGVREAAGRGHDVIMSPSNHVYLDMKYTPDFPLGLDWSGCVDVRRSWEWDPDTHVDGVEAARVRGVEAPLWTETVATREDLFTMLLPRLVAVAEVAWSDQAVRERDGFDGFSRRLAGQVPVWRGRDWAFHPSQDVDWDQAGVAPA
ncbi:hexosaminidase [Georgenia soli]|uniref:beta-N-acetylhexosaminidase n=1 Tax=Georgenia soli TaxID=638953 RepID=A0A2A9EKV7_9MICO|nr:family 20 glycosylhydrolase [Georgenia soli]PFG38885.1 hexosaminidase [Georgenia soli]